MLGFDLTYFATAGPATAVALIMVCVLLTFMIVRNVHEHYASWAAVFLFGAYLLVVAWVVTARGDSGKSAVNLVPFERMAQAIRFNNSRQYVQYILNVILFVPLGLLLPMVWKWSGRWQRIALIAFCVSVAIEVSQLLPAVARSFDADDIICNAVGALVGFAVYVVGRKIRRGERLSGASLAAAACMCAVFALLCVHPAMSSGTSVQLEAVSSFVPTVTSLSKEAEVEQITAEFPIFRVREDGWDTLIEEGGPETKFESGWLHSPVLTPDEAAVCIALDKLDSSVQPCSIEEAVRRANLGTVVNVYADCFIGKPLGMEVDNASVVYMCNDRQDSMVPVWLLEGRITQYDSIRGFHGLNEGDEDLLTPEMQHIELVVPAV